MTNYKDKFILYPNQSTQIKKARKAAFDSNLKHIIEVSDQNQPEQKTMPSSFDKHSHFKQIVHINENFGCFKRFIYCMTKLTTFLLRQSQKQYQTNIEKQIIRSNKIKEQLKKCFNRPILPAQLIQRKVLILDLDETLIHTTFNKPNKYDFQLDVIYNGKKTKIYSTKRFGLDHFIFQMSQMFELIIFTASHKLYADEIINRIDPKGRIAHRIYRQNCIEIQGMRFLKNINNVGRDLSKIILVDDSAMNGLLQPQNFYQIPSFTGNQKDRHLCRLSSFLKYIHDKKHFKSIKVQRQNFDQMQIHLSQNQNQHTNQRNPKQDQCMKKSKHMKSISEVDFLSQIDDKDQISETATSIMKNV